VLQRLWLAAAEEQNARAGPSGVADDGEDDGSGDDEDGDEAEAEAEAAAFDTDSDDWEGTQEGVGKLHIRSSSDAGAEK
jgi:hypothetical protein